MAVTPEQQTFGAAAAGRLNTALQARTGTSATFTAAQWTAIYRVLMVDDTATRNYTQRWLDYRQQVLARAEALHTMAQQSEAAEDAQEVATSLRQARDTVAALVGMAYNDNAGPGDDLVVPVTV